MAIQFWWWLGAIALGIAEMFTGSFYLLVLAAGAGAAGLAAALDAGPAAQFLVAAIVSAAGAAIVRRLYPHSDNLPSQRNPDVNLDIGQTIEVEQWDAHGRSRAAYRGALWDVELLPGEPAAPGRFLIREIDGSRLRLSRAGVPFDPTTTASNRNASPDASPDPPPNTPPPARTTGPAR
jgi:membrane protein implicated in regulation of membrane protease activity